GGGGGAGGRAPPLGALAGGGGSRHVLAGRCPGRLQIPCLALELEQLGQQGGGRLGSSGMPPIARLLIGAPGGRAVAQLGPAVAHPLQQRGVAARARFAIQVARRGRVVAAARRQLGKRTEGSRAVG